MFKKEFFLHLVFFLIFLYFSQGVLISPASIISKSILFVFLGLCGVFLFSTLLFIPQKQSFYWAWTALLTLNILSFTFTGSLSNEVQFSMIKGVLISLLPFYPIYYFSVRGVAKRRHLITFFIVFLPLVISHYYLDRQQSLTNLISNNENIVTNKAYSIVALIPFLFLIKRLKWLSALLMLLLVYFIIQAAKRGAVLVATVGILIYLIDFFLSQKNVRKRNKTIMMFVSFIFIAAIVYYSYTFYVNNEFLIERMNMIDQGGSGRDRIYKNVFFAWYNSESFWRFLFGYGFASSYSLSGAHLLAHNDWLELLSNMGLLGFVVYLILFISAFNLILSKDWIENHRLIFLSIIMMWFTTTLFSMAYMDQEGFFRAVLLAYILGNRECINRNMNSLQLGSR